MKKYLLILLLIPIVILAQQLDDVVYLKDGSIVRGMIIEQVPNGHIKIQSCQNVFVYQIGEIEKMTKEIPLGKTVSNNSLGQENSFPLTKGTKNISGSISFASNFYDEEETSTISIIAPSIGFFLSDNYCTDFGLNIITWRQGAYKTTSSTLIIGGKYYFSIGGFGRYYSGLHLRYSSLKSLGDDFAVDSKAIDIVLGALKGINDFVYLDYGIIYLKGRGDYDKSSQLAFSFGISTFIK